jgi:essential nuclear protein 1
MTQRFLEDIILGHVRENIHENKKLNVHLYKALKKALYKPAAFFKGILFPLVESGTCTLREAHIISSILARVSIPMTHSAAALLQLCDIAAEQFRSTEGGGATNIFIRVFVEKKYALPYKVIETLVFHFLRFLGADPAPTSVTDTAGSGMVGVTNTSVIQGKLPVVWHQSLLAFAQRYKNDITEEQRELLLDLLRLKGHHDIGPEVRRELLAGRDGGVESEQPLMDGDDTMIVDPI